MKAENISPLQLDQDPRPSAKPREGSDSQARMLRFLGLTIWTIAALFAIVLVLGRNAGLAPVSYACLLPPAFAAGWILNRLLGSGGRLSLSLSDPQGLYGVFFIIYFITSFTVALCRGQLPLRNQPAIAMLVFGAYASFSVGCRIAEVVFRAEPAPRLNLRPADPRTLACFCALGIALVIYQYMVRTAEGSFFTHAAYHEEDTTVRASIVSVFAGCLELPLVLLTGLAASMPGRIGRFWRIGFFAYGAGLCLVYVLSSQTRPCVTAMLFMAIAVQFFRPIQLRLHHVLLLLVPMLLSVIVIHGVRTSSALEYAEADNQAMWALTRSIPAAVEGVTSGSAELVDSISTRSVSGMGFLSTILDKTSEMGFLRGQGVLESAYALIPRFIWPDKPQVANGNLTVRRLFRLPTTDDGLTSINQLYAESGTLGVIFGHCIYGYLVAWLTIVTFRRGRVTAWLVLVFVWSIVVQMEIELILSMLSIIRISVVLALLYNLAVYVQSIGTVRETRVVAHRSGIAA